MKFVFITREGYRDPGARIRCYGLAKCLKEKGFDTDVFSFVDDLGAKSGEYEDNFRFKEKLYFLLKSFKPLKNRVSKKTIFVVNRFNYHAISPWIISKFNKVPFIFDIDDWEAKEGDSTEIKDCPVSKADFLTRKFAKESIFCIAASRFLKSYLERFNERVFYIPTGVDTEEFSFDVAKIKREDFIFSWHGAVNRRETLRYIQFIMDCFLALYRKYSHIKLFIAGSGVFVEELKILIDKYNCPGIIYKGYIDCKDIPEYLNNVDIGLYPLLEETYFNLSKSPVKLFEYMAKGKPVIASSTGETNSIIKDGFNGFLAQSKQGFIENMENTINNLSLVKQVGLKARKTIEDNYSLRIMVNKFYYLASGYLREYNPLCNEE